MSSAGGTGSASGPELLDLWNELRAGGGDPREVQRRLHGPLARFCRGYLHDEGEAEDAAQEVLLKALASDDAPLRPRAWLLAIARNHCLNRLRDRAPRRAEPLEGELELAASLTGPLTRLARDEQRAALARLVERLSEAQREVLRLRYGEGLSREEIAEVLDLPAKVVKSRLFEAVDRLRTLAAD